MLKFVLSVFIVFCFSEVALSSDVFSGAYKFSRSMPNEGTSEGIIFISPNIFSSQELDKLRAHKFFKELPKDGLEAYISNKNTCIALGKSLILSKSYQMKRTNYISRKFSIPVFTWVDASYGFVLEVQKNLLRMKSYNAKSISAENEEFEIEKLATDNIDVCLNQITNTMEF